MHSYNYDIEAKPIIPPLARFNYYAKLSYFYKIEDGKPDKKIYPDTGDNCYGETEKEAKEKLKLKIENWIKENQ